MTLYDYMIFTQSIFGRITSGMVKDRAKSELQNKLLKARIFVPVEAFYSFILFVATAVFSVITIMGFAFISVLAGGIYATSIGIALGMGFVAALIGGSIVYIFPTFMGMKTKTSVETGLPFALSFMAIMASSGLPPRKIFEAVARLETTSKLGLGGEGTLIYRDLEILGSDLVTALKDASKRKVSPLFSGVCEGLVTTIHSGANLSSYLEAESKSFMTLRSGTIKSYINALVMISEVYLSILVVFPLILIVMLVVMTSIGGGDIGGTNPETIIPVLVYLMIPAAGAMVMFWLDSVSPG